MKIFIGADHRGITQITNHKSQNGGTKLRIWEQGALNRLTTRS